MLKKIELTKFNETIYYDKCENGLDIYLWPNNKVNNYYATLSVKYGSIDTSFQVNNKEYEVPKGIAHFLEHVKFNEGPNFTAHDYYNKLGSSINAFTTFDYTSYEVFGSENIEDNVGHLLDYVQNPYFTKELIEKEKKIIISEVKMVDNNPAQVLYYALNRALYNEDNHKYYVTGDVEDVKSITLEDIKLVYDTFYHPKNMFLVVTGNFDPDYLDVIIRENQNKKEFQPYTNPVKIKKKEEPTVCIEEQEIQGNIAVSKVKIAFKIKASSINNLSDIEKLLYTRIILNANFGTTSEIKEKLLESKLVSKLGHNASLVGDYLIIVISAETNYPHEIIKILKENYLNMDLSLKRLERRIKCNIADFIYGLDDVEFTNAYIQDNIISYNKIIENQYNIIKNLNLEKAKKVIKQLQNNSSCTVIMNPMDKKENETN